MYFLLYLSSSTIKPNLGHDDVEMIVYTVLATRITHLDIVPTTTQQQQQYHQHYVLVIVLLVGGSVGCKKEEDHNTTAEEEDDRKEKSEPFNLTNCLAVAGEIIIEDINNKNYSFI